MNLLGAAAFAALCVMGVAPGFAAEAQPAPDPAAAAGGKLTLELNKAEPADKSCTVTFAVINRSPVSIQSSKYVMSLFDPSGQVVKLVPLKFPAFPIGKPRVIQFALDVTCDKIAGIVANAVECVADDGSTAAVCDDATMRSRSPIQFPFNIE